MKPGSLAELIRFLRAAKRGGEPDGLELSGPERRSVAKFLAGLPEAAMPAPAADPSPGRVSRGAPKASELPSGARALLHCDGASHGNPGPAALGFVILLDGEELYARGEALGRMSNNQAEYRALLAGLEAVHQLGFARLDVALDSELVVRQIEGRYKVKNEGLKPLHAQALRSLARFEAWSIRHVPRAQNAAADALANEALGSL